MRNPYASPEHVNEPLGDRHNRWPLWERWLFGVYLLVCIGAMWWVWQSVLAFIRMAQELD